MSPYTIFTRLGFLAGAITVGAFATFVVGEFTAPSGFKSFAHPLPPQVVSTPGQEAGDGGVKAAAFDLIPAPSLGPLAGLDPAQLELVASALPENGPSPNGLPRVPAISQFDGSPFQGVNCNMAAGAMLARLGWGIVTDGATLRSLQDDMEGGTDLKDLATALWRGYGVAPSWGGVKPAQLRSLIGAGYGAVVHGIYGILKPPYSKQPSFTGPHAIFVDAYFPGSQTTEPAYYVVDPLHQRGSGYRGEWIPAQVIEQFALAFGGERIMAAWAFPTGGQPPEIPDIGPLPQNGGVTPDPGEPEPDPADPPVELPEEPGDETPQIPEPPGWFDGPVLVGEVLVPRLDVCVIRPAPAFCPGGIIGRYGNAIPGRIGSLFPKIQIRSVDAAKPNDVVVAFTVSPPGPVEVDYWRADGTGGIMKTASFSSLAIPGSDPVLVGHLSTMAATSYKFKVVVGGIIGARSPVGSFTTGPGVKSLDLQLTTINQPRIALDSVFSVYSRLRADSLAYPLIACPSGGDLVRILLGGSSWCRSDASIQPPASCAAVRVSYEIAGLPGKVAVRAHPTGAATNPDGSPAEDAVLEVIGPEGSGEVTVGCLLPGETYQVALDIVGDAMGTLLTREVTVPAS